MKKMVDFISHIGEDITIRLIDNGYLIEVGGKDAQDNWKTVKLACANRDELNARLDQCFSLPRAD